MNKTIKLNNALLSPEVDCKVLNNQIFIREQKTSIVIIIDL